MTHAEAIATVTQQRQALGADEESLISGVEKAIVEHMADRSRPGPVEHRVAWLVTLSSAHGFARVQVDDASGRVLHVERTA